MPTSINSESSHSSPLSFGLRAFTILYWLWWLPLALFLDIYPSFFSFPHDVRERLLPAGAILTGSMLVAAIIRGMVLFYRAWKILEGLSEKYQLGAEVSAGSALGLMFVPFFHLYWVFVAFRGWAKRVNRIVIAEKLQMPHADQHLMLATGVDLCLCYIP